MFWLIWKKNKNQPDAQPEQLQVLCKLQKFTPPQGTLKRVLFVQGRAGARTELLTSAAPSPHWHGRVEMCRICIAWLRVPSAHPKENDKGAPYPQAAARLIPRTALNYAALQQGPLWPRQAYFSNVLTTTSCFQQARLWRWQEARRAPYRASFADSR